MAITFVEIEDRYKPKTTNEIIKVSVVIGDAGIGGYLIFLDLDLIAANETASLGNAAAVLGKWTTVSVTIPDVLEETNWTSLTVFVHEGTSKTKFGSYAKEVPAHLDTVCFIIKILNTDEE